MTDKKIVNTGIRIVSMLIDHIAMTFIAGIFFLPQLISEFSTAFEVSHEQTNSSLFNDFNYFLLIGFALYFTKDSINGRSIAKRIFKLQVVENSTGRVASPIRCLIRNLLIIIWPIEVIVCLANPSRRLGDFIAGTRVVQYNSEQEKVKLDFAQIILSLVLAYSLIFLLMFSFNTNDLLHEKNHMNYVESSLNEKSTEQTEELISQEFGSILTPDVKVYDKIEKVEELKYVSVILHLKEDLFKNEEELNKMKPEINKLLLNIFPERTFIGRVKYVYKEKGRMQTATNYIDWRIIDGL